MRVMQIPAIRDAGTVSWPHDEAMTTVYYEFRASDAVCADCGASMITRVQLVDTALRHGIERWRKDECPEVMSHRSRLESV